MNMKKIYKSLLFALVAAVPFLTSCKDDNDSNPTLSIPNSFVLNTPEFAANNLYDLPGSSVTLTTTQPDYGGWPAAVIYAVQVSLDGSEGSWTELGTTSTSTVVKANGDEINTAVLDMYRAANNDQDPDGSLPIYLRLRAYLSNNTNNLGECYSNAVQVNVLAYEPPAEVALPTAVYVCGNSIADAWSTWKPLAPVYGKDGRFYTLIYNGGDGFKWGNKPNDWFGYDMIDTFDDQAGAGISAASDGNIVFANAGWYVLEFIAKIVGNDVKYTLIVNPGDACVIGNAVDNGSWSGVSMNKPDGKGEWTFTDFTGDGELRAYINVPGEDWWRTEFTLYNGELFWRTMDIPHNWAEDLGAEYSVTVGAGKKLVVDFDRNTGSVE